MQKRLLILSISIVALAGVLWWYLGSPQRFAFMPTKRATPVGTEKLPISPEAEKMQDREIIAENLEIPWEIAFLPDKSMLVTERPGRLLHIGSDRKAIPIAGVSHTGEGGLLGMALHPDFAQNNLLYIYLTTETPSGLTNRVQQYTLQNNTVTNRKTILENIPGSRFHDGGRIAFGPDKKLYITTGDAGQEPLAQNTNSLAGKILRINDDGSIPSDNPFGNAVFSFGHRNPQGITWDASGNLWASEHGRSGAESGFDEINLIEKGENYGWPNIEGSEAQSGMEPPKAHSGASETWAPSGAAIYNDSLLFAGLRGEALYEAKLSGKNIEKTIAHLPGQFGRLRTVAVGPDGMLYILTNNTDGRGNPKSGDDKIIKINPELIGL